ncbi:hypothetical protein KJ662_05275 [Patescibacteria group bacterium]|nr:hypothetical protein [Patescibacteria group bacterium]MBU1685631.1 hypothetical protein [Patescibacteria group bacterium]
MKQPKLQQSPASSPTSSRLRIGIILGAIGLAGTCGYEAGLDSPKEAVAQLRSDLRVKDEALTESENRADQCRTALQAVTARKKILSKWLDFTGKQLADKQLPEGISNEDVVNQCVDITAKAFDRLSSDLAHLLNITNPGDIDKIFRAMKRGYTKVEFISEDGKHISLTDPGFDSEADQGVNSSAYLDLDEPIEDIPDEFKPDKIPKTEEELAMAEHIANGQFEDIITDFDLEAIQPPGKTEKMIHGNLLDLQSKLSETDDPEKRMDLFCSFFGAIMQQEIAEMENPDEETPPTEYTPEDMKNSRLIDLYMEAVMKSLGIEDEEDCLKYILNRPPCDCSGGDGEN